MIPLDDGEGEILEERPRRVRLRQRLARQEHGSGHARILSRRALAPRRPRTRELPEYTRELPEYTRELPEYTRELPEYTRELPEYTRELPEYTRDLPEYTRELPEYTRGTAGVHA